MDQTTARRRAKELRGIAVSARWNERRQRWNIGGWPSAADEWIVIDVSRSRVLDDGRGEATDKPGHELQDDDG